MRRLISFIAATHWCARIPPMRKLRSPRPWRSCLALVGFACATFLSVASFAQGNPPLNFGDNFFVTGDYVVAGAYGMTTNFSNGYAVGTFVVPDANPGIHGTNFVPLGAEVVAAFVYWQTVENAGIAPGQPGSGQNGFFRPLIPNGPPAPGYPVSGVSLPGQNAVSWSSGGCSEPQAGKITRTYRANVLGSFPQDNKGNILADGAFEIRLPSVGPSTPLTLGATLVIVYRVLSPTVPLNSIVIYDGAFGQSDVALNMTQTVQGFYDADHHPVSKLTLIAGAGKSNKYQTVYLDNIALPSHSGHNLPPFPGYYGDWDNPTWTFGNPFYQEIANPVPEDAASATAEVVPSANGAGCLSWGAVIFSTTVKNPDGDGLLKSWKTAGGYCDASINGGVCTQGSSSDPGWVALPGATLNEKDLFIQLDYMCSQTTGVDSCAPRDGTNYSFDPRPSGAAAMMVQAFLNHGVHVHINPTGPKGPADTIQPVHAIEEQNCSDLPGPPQALCAFPNQAGVVGWKGGYAYFKNQLVETGSGNALNCLGANPARDCQPRFQHGRKDSWHYALFAHAVGRTEWKLQGGTLTSVVQFGNTVTFTTSTPLGTLSNAGYDNHGNILPDPSCLNGRVSIYYAATNPNLNGTFCINTSAAPFGDTFTIVVPGPSENAHYTLSTDPYLSVAPGQTGSASGVSDVGGADSLITLGLWGDPTSASSNGQQKNTIAGTFMHETGHSLGLTHGGFYYDLGLSLLGIYTPTIEPNCKPNFQSVMNYFFQVDLLNGALDYSEQQLDPLNEANLPAGITYRGGAPFYPSTKWYTPIPPLGVGSKVSSHCDGTPPLPSDPPATFLVPGAADPISPAWDRPKSDVDFDGVINSQSPYLRGYSDWAPGGTVLGGITTGIDFRQIGATGNISVVSELNFFGGGINLNGGGINLNGGGINLNGGGQNLNGGGINLNGGGINLNGGGINLNGGGQALNGGGINLNGGGEIDQKTADSYTRPPTGLVAAEAASSRSITLTWTAPTFGQIGTYKIYRSADGGKTFTVVASVNGNPPATTYADTVACLPTGYQYFVTAVLSATSTNPGQESVPSNIVSATPPSVSPLTGCYVVTGFSSPANAVQGSPVSVSWTLTDDFYGVNNPVARQAANTLVAIGPLPNNCTTSGRTTLLADGTPTNAADMLSNNGDLFTFTWNSTDAFCAGSYTFELDLDHAQGSPAQVVNGPALQFSIDVNDTDSAPHVGTSALPAGTVGAPYGGPNGYALPEDGGTPPFKWTFTGSLPPGVSTSPAGVLSGISCVAVSSSNFVATVTDSAAKPNSGSEPLTLQINMASTTTSVGSNANASVFQQAVTFTITVAPQFSCTPTGTVTLLDSGAAIASNLPLAGGIATFTTSALSVGVHSITASYSGDSNFNSSGSTTFSQTVNMASTTIAANPVLPSPAVAGQPVTVTYNFAVTPPGAGAPIAPSGSITATASGASDASSCMPQPAVLGLGACVLSPTQTAAGNKMLTIAYPGDGNFVASGANGNYNVYPAAPASLYASTITSSSINLVWTPGATTNVSGYNVYRSLSATGPFTLLPASPLSGDSTNFSDASVVTSTIYYYQVTTLAGGLESAPSSVARVPFGFTYEQIQSAAAPSARCCVAMADPGNLTVLFGGTVPGQGYLQVNDTWELQGGQWTQLSPANAPPARSGAAMVFFPPTGQMVLFGGTFGGNPTTGDYNDTWTFDESTATWTQVIANGAAGSPPARRFDSQGMAYDPNTQTIVMFGGVTFDGSTFFNDTWVLSFNSGTWTWTQQPQTTSPSPRRTVLATDPSGNVLLFGGTGTGGDLNDTWVWNGTWNQQFPAMAPPVRDMHNMAFDPDMGVVVLFGGSTAQATVGYNDTWIWDGANWTQVSLGATPPQRYAFGMDYDATAKALAIFGGYTAGGPAINDTWVLALAPQAPAGLEATPPAPGAVQVVLNWTASPTPNVSYYVKRGTTMGGPYTTITTLGAVTTFTDTVPGSGTYYYVVTAVTGPGGVESVSSNEASVSVMPVAPPTSLTATPNVAAQCSVTLSWTASNTGGVTGYNVYQELPQATMFTEIASLSPTTLTFMDASNSACVAGTFTYQVTAVGPTGTESVPSNQATATFQHP